MSTINNRWIQTINLTDYCNNYALKKGTPFIIRKGKGYHVVEGMEISMAAFDKAFPVPEVIFYKENSNSKDDWKNKP